MLGFGSNRFGQLGVPGGDELIPVPTAVPMHLDEGVIRLALSATQTDIVTTAGLLFTCGENDNNELGRAGKRSLLQRVDAVETFRVSDAAVGDKFSVLATADGKFLSWGRNESGQLGNGNRELKEKPRQSNYAGVVIQVCSGSEHTVAVTKEGNVVTWGANRKGQLGNGQFTSCCEPEPIHLLRHRPVISVCCGENHSLALTIGGNVYAWGDNSQGQLGLNDTTNRLRPEIIRSLRNALVKSISAGKQHSMAISPKGVLFAFGSNSRGQLGLGEDGQDIRFMTSPTVVDKLRNHFAIQVSCGHSHTMVLCTLRENVFSSQSQQSKVVFVMGLNSSGQLGLGHVRDISQPTQLPSIAFQEGGNPSAVASGPLAFHSFIVSDKVLLNSPTLPSVNVEQIRTFASYLERVTVVDANKLRQFREAIASSFSSISVLNSSFIDLHGTNSDPNTLKHSAISISNRGLHVDMKQVRDAYSLLVAMNNDQVISTIGRATLHVAESLKECPFDDAENLSVFLIVLENPLLLSSSKYQIAIQRVITGILSLPKSYRLLLFSWFKHYESEYFARVIKVIQNYLTFTCEDTVSRLDSSPAVLVLESLYECNSEAAIVPNDLFYNSAICKKYKIGEEWHALKSTTMKAVFNICSYPFLFSLEVKNDLITGDFNLFMMTQSTLCVNKYIIGPMARSESRVTPRGVVMEQSLADGGINVYFEIVVSREDLVRDTFVQVSNALLDDKDTLKLPLRVKFVNEDAIDMGGVKKEFFSLFIKEFISGDADVFGSCSDNSQQVNRGSMLWFKRISSSSSMKDSVNSNTHKRLRLEDYNFTVEYLFGIIIGLAVYHRVLINLPLPPHVFKIMKGMKLGLSDVWAADTSLARSLQYLLDYNERSIQDDIGTTFVASANPLLSAEANAYLSGHESIELKPGGTDLFVNKANRFEFVDLFVHHALYRCCSNAVDDFLAGLRQIIDSPVVNMTSVQEFEALMCGSVDLSDFMKLQECTHYEGSFSVSHPIIQWFWNIAGTFTVAQQRQFLQFVTGSDHIPIGGVQKIGLIIQSTSQPDSALPTAHTCFSTLKLPSSYADESSLRRKIIQAIEEYSRGFGFL